jgi:hypothetical protein
MPHVPHRDFFDTIVTTRSQPIGTYLGTRIQYHQTSSNRRVHIILGEASSMPSM